MYFNGKKLVWCKAVTQRLLYVSFLVLVLCRFVLLGATWLCCWIHTHTTQSSGTPFHWTSPAMPRCSWRGCSTCSSRIISRPKQKQWWKGLFSFSLWFTWNQNCFVEFPHPWIVSVWIAVERCSRLKVLLFCYCGIVVQEVHLLGKKTGTPQGILDAFKPQCLLQVPFRVVLRHTSCSLGTLLHS